jgi:hypothetical protein
MAISSRSVGVQPATEFSRALENLVPCSCARILLDHNCGTLLPELVVSLRSNLSIETADAPAGQGAPTKS